MVSMKKQLAIMLLEEEKVMLSAAAYFQIMKKEKPARKEKSIWMKSRLQLKVFYGQYEKLVAELRGEDTKGFRNYIVSRNPSVKWRPVRTTLEAIQAPLRPTSLSLSMQRGQKTDFSR